MKVLNEKPPEWIMQGCLSQFRVDPHHTVFTYGDTLYNPGGLVIPDHLMAHEQTHTVQQERYKEWAEGKSDDITDPNIAGRQVLVAEGKDAWWKRYLIDPEFRMEQEVQAYAMQYAFYCKQRKDRNERFRFLNSLAGTLAGPLYQLPIGLSDARKAIKETAEALQPSLL